MGRYLLRYGMSRLAPFLNVKQTTQRGIIGTYGGGDIGSSTAAAPALLVIVAIR